MIAMLAVCAGVLVSCGDDDDEDTNSIVGTWKYTEEGYWLKLTFNANQTFTWYEEETENGETWTASESGTWSIDGDILSIYVDGYSDYAKFSVSGNTLLLYWSDDDGGFDPEPEVYYRQ